MPDGAIWFSNSRTRLKVPVVWSFWWIRAIHPKPVATAAIASSPFRSQIAGLIARAGYRLTEASNTTIDILSRGGQLRWGISSPGGRLPQEAAEF